MSSFEILLDKFDMSHNYKNYRAYLHTVSPPGIPYIGLLPKDIISLEETPTEVNGRVNFVSGFKLKSSWIQVESVAWKKENLKLVWEKSNWKRLLLEFFQLEVNFFNLKVRWLLTKFQGKLRELWRIVNQLKPFRDAKLRLDVSSPALTTYIKHLRNYDDKELYEDSVTKVISSWKCGRDGKRIFKMKINLNLGTAETKTVCSSSDVECVEQQ